AQAEYILELRLRRLTKFSRIELEAEADELRREIAELEALLADESLLRRKVSDELADVAERFATPRRTVLTEAAAPVNGKQKKSGALSAEELRQADAPTRVIMSATG